MSEPSDEAKERAYNAFVKTPAGGYLGGNTEERLFNAVRAAYAVDFPDASVASNAAPDDILDRAVFFLMRERFRGWWYEDAEQVRTLLYAALRAKAVPAPQTEARTAP